MHAIFRRLGLDVKIRPVLDIDSEYDDVDDGDDYDGEAECVPQSERKGRDHKQPPRLVGTGLHKLVLESEMMVGDDEMVCVVATPFCLLYGVQCKVLILRLILTQKTIQTTWPSTWRRKINWLNEQGPKELAMVQLTVCMQHGPCLSLPIDFYLYLTGR